jgi:hypothetical protein
MGAENIIQKQILYLDVHSQVASPFALQEATAKWCSEVLVDALGRRLEKYAGTEDVIRIDKIEIQLNADGTLDEILAEKIAFEVEREVGLKVHSESKSRHTVVNKERTVVDVFLFFLQHGYLPWWTSIKTIEELTLVEQFSDDESRTLKEFLKDKTTASRFATALPQTIFINMLSKLFQISEKQTADVFQKIERLASKIQDRDLQYQFLILTRQQFISACVKGQDETVVIKQATDLLIAKYKISHGELKNFIASDVLLSTDNSPRHIPLDDLLIEVINPEQSEKLNEQKRQLERQQLALKQDGIYIGNAGLVLLAPFIPRFFENLGIVENNMFNSKDLAVSLLQWLVTGNELYAEFNLVFPKIICGMEPEEPVVIIPHLPEGFKNEGEALLQSVIEHWNILKNTSVEGLRESFLQREGKLSFQKNEWLLQVEQKPYDMLLEHLPWNISMIRLSWMPYLLRTEWVG